MGSILAYVNMIMVVLLPTALVAVVIFFLYARKLISSYSAHRKEEMRVLDRFLSQ